MTKFLLKCFFIITVLFSGVLIGIQVASNSMVKMTGDNQYSTANISFLTETSNGASILPVETKETEKITSHDLESKQAKLEEIESFNLFSQIGVSLSDGLNVLFSKMLAKITVTIGDLLK